MKTIKLLNVLLLFMLSQSCTKDADSSNGTSKNTYYYLTAGALNQTPYFTNPAFDTISFASDKGDTLTFVKTRTDTTWDCEDKSFETNDMDCYQTIHNSYATIKGVGSFDVNHCRKITYRSLPNVIILQLNNVYFLVGDEQIGYSGYWTYKKEVILKSKSFKDVIVLYPNSYDSLTAEGYINKDKGLLYFIDKLENTNYTILN